MKVINTYSFKRGEKFLKAKHPKELSEVLQAIKNLDAIKCLTKESAEKTMKGALLFSPRDMNHHLKTALHKKNWTAKASDKKKEYAEPRHAFGGGRFREMDGMKNKVGLEIQFGKYAFMFYDMAKFQYFFNENKADVGIEIVPCHAMHKQMSTGVSCGQQLVYDIERVKRHFPAVPVKIVLIDV